MLRTTGAGAALVVVMMAACSSGPAVDTAGTATTSAVETSVDATTTTAAPTTSPPLATEPPPTAPPTTTPSLDDEVRAAYELVYRGYWECLRSPLACDTSWLFEGSPSATAMTETMQALADRDRYVGDDDVGYYVIEEIRFEDGGTALVTSCWWSTAVLYGAPVNPDLPPGPENPATIVNNTPSGGRQSDKLSMEGSRWLSFSGDLLDEGSESNPCPPTQ